MRSASLIRGSMGKEGGLGRSALLVLKISITAACFWYVAQHVRMAELIEASRSFGAGWIFVAIIAITLNIPFSSYRWCFIVDAIVPAAAPAPRGQMMAITAIGTFFSQVLPYVAGDTIRVVMLSQLGYDWRRGAVGVAIDRAIGIAVVIALAFAFFLFSTPASLGSARDTVLLLFGTLLLLGIVGLLAAPLLARMLKRWPKAYWPRRLIEMTHEVLVGSRRRDVIIALTLAIHALTIISLWALGRAQGFQLSFLDAGVLFSVIVAAAILPISVGGWGVREVAVVALMQAHGVAQERAFLFSVCFGFVLILASLPGAIVWLFYTPTRARYETPANVD